jgi:hypothetical protein
MNKQSAAQVSASQAATIRSAENVVKAADAVKDAGRVRIGNGMLRF